MIHVFRARSARELRIPPDEPPLVVAATVGELAAALARSPLTRPECEAVLRAAEQLAGARDARILVAANGSIFRVERPQVAPPAREARPAAVNWATTERGAPVVVATDDPGWDRRAAAALRFVGFAARPAEKSPLATVMTAPPLVLVVAAAALDDELVSAASDRCALVAVVPAGESPPPGAHGTLARPLDTASAAAVLDTLVRRARTGRLRLGKATPRP